MDFIIIMKFCKEIIRLYDPEISWSYLYNGWKVVFSIDKCPRIKSLKSVDENNINQAIEEANYLLIEIHRNCLKWRGLVTVDLNQIYRGLGY